MRSSTLGAAELVVLGLVFGVVLGFGLALGFAAGTGLAFSGERGLTTTADTSAGAVLSSGGFNMASSFSFFHWNFALHHFCP